MNKNHVTPAWLHSAMEDPEDPWILQTSSPQATGHRDACVGNGLIGMRVNSMGDATMERTVDYYRVHYDDNPIMMGYAIDGIIDCRLGRSREVSEPLGHLSRYFRLPFLITTESPANERLPFLTGMGGFLQFVANGMAGLITDQPGGLASHWACLPDGIDWIRLHGIHHAGKRHGVELKRDASGKPVVEISPEAYSLR